VRRGADLIGQVVRACERLHGGPPTERFVHNRQRFAREEWQEFQSAVPASAKLVGMRIRSTLFRPDANVPVLRGTAVTLGKREGYLWTTAYIPRLRTYTGFETPKPIAINIDRQPNLLAEPIGSHRAAPKHTVGVGEFLPMSVAPHILVDTVARMLSASD
jgi:hypothetical protein